MESLHSKKDSEILLSTQKIDELSTLNASLHTDVANQKREISHLENEASTKVREMEKLQSQNLEITQHMEDLNIEKEEVITSNVFLINQLNDKNDTIHALISEKEEMNKEITKLEVTLEGTL